MSFSRIFQATALAVVLAVPLTGCFETISGPYDGPPLVEFDQVAGGYSADVPEGAGVISLRVNLIGPQQGSPITINVATTEGTTAVEGTHYAFPNGATVTIPANASSGQLQIDILDDSLAADESGVLNLELTGSSDGTIEGADNFDDFSIQIVGQ